MAESARRLSVWLAEEGERPRRRGRAPGGLTRERIVRTAMKLLDREGLDAFSMRKLAAELGVTPMSVYWYVDNRGELLELALDEVHGELRLPDPAVGSWQEQLRALAREMRRVLSLHPWAVLLRGAYLGLGPHTRTMSQRAIEVMLLSRLAPDRIPSALSLVVHFVHGTVGVDARWRQRAAESGIDQQEFYALAIRTAERVDPGLIAVARELEPDLDAVGIEAAGDRDFEHALDCAVLGIEAMIAAGPPEAQRA
ncbi:TetR/AcrR family transcriptional regulator [Phaeacidiphilus oryzae]|uniref:TetR/AcrR family transcriptional regulator n=1 Tax=Phaeacidiphilus oryzae TaxID=348818 RepID=UPI00056662C0|nr:TetR/AcrR family transcriptional regulator C-terminal domain-containing protein [Phaeacidiphilus oryzae]